MTEKILSLSAADEWFATQRSAGLRVGFTCGSFDILHAGHVNLLERARSHCDRLMVAVNSDDSIRSYKNPLRPINPENQRMKVVAGLAAADAVVLMEDTRPARLLERWKPALYIKGGDYEKSGLRSRGIVEGYGGQVVLLPFEEDSSSTSVIRKIEQLASYSVLPASREVPSGIVFVDRDGTLIENIPYLHEPARVRLLPGVGEGLQELQRAGFRLVMVTNQQGIGLSYYSIDDFFAVNLELFRQLSPFGVTISRVAFCPHSQADSCKCRKPLPGMIEAALRHYNVSSEACYMVGDTRGDVEAGEAAGCSSILVGDASAAGNRVPDFAAAVGLILERSRVKAQRS